MSKAKLEPYLSFNGNCEEAMKFYQSILGGELEFSRFSDFADKGMPAPEGRENKIMHSSLKNGDLSFMASDAMSADEIDPSNIITMSIAGDDEEKLTKYFEGLSLGGKVTQPLAKQVWGDKFGMLTDRYGISWMINISSGGN